jgi:hypothetical protein
MASDAPEGRLEFQKIDSAESFLTFMRELLEDLRSHPRDWENLTLDGYLEAMAAWTEAMCERRNDPIDPRWANAWRGLGHVPPYVPDNVDWHFIARMLAAPKSYE